MGRGMHAYQSKLASTAFEGSSFRNDNDMALVDQNPISRQLERDQNNPKGCQRLFDCGTGCSIIAIETVHSSGHCNKKKSLAGARGFSFDDGIRVPTWPTA